MSLLTSRSSAYLVAAVVTMLIASRLPVRAVAEWLVDASPGRWAAADPVGSRLAHSRASRSRVVRSLVYLSGCAALVGVLGLVYLPGLGVEINGSHRWIDLGLLGLGTAQPSEIVKWVMPMLLAWFVTTAWALGRMGEGRGPSLVTDVGPALIGLGLVSAAIVVEDLGTGVLVASAGGLVLLGAGMRLWHAMLFIPPALLAVGYAILSSPYRIQRVQTFIDPFADPQGDSYHLIQSLATVAGGGVFGRGLGHGLQKFGYLPQDTTDFLFAVVCEELGLAGATAVVFMLVLLVLALARIARGEREPMLKLYVLGVAATVAVQAMINLFVVLGLAPTKGIALPLISAGGTGWILTAGSLGLAASIARTQPQVGAEIAEPDTGDQTDRDHAGGQGMRPVAG